jgi:transposase
VDATLRTQDEGSEPRVAELLAENASLRSKLREAQNALAHLQARYHQMLEELHLLKHRLVVAKAERPEDVEGAQLAFDSLLEQTEALKKEIEQATPEADAGSVETEDESAAPPPGGKKRPRTGAPPTGRRDLDKLDLPIVRVEIPDPELEGKAERIGVEEHSRVGYDCGGYRRVIITRFVYKVEDESLRAEGSPTEEALPASERGSHVAIVDAESSADASPETSPGARILTAPMPKEIMKRGMLAPSMIAHLLTMKYVLGVPFHRYEQRCAAEGFPLDRATMCRYAEHVGATFGCIVEAARKEAIETAFCLSTDATGIAIQPTPLGNGNRQPCRKGHFFVTLADRDHVFFDFQPKHKSLTVWNMFKGYAGYVQADAHAIYDALFKGIPPDGADEAPDPTRTPPKEVGCLAHARRKYWEAAMCKHAVGLEGVKLIDAIFAADKLLAKLPPSERKPKRDETVRPLVDAFFTWVAKERDKVTERGLVATALGYSFRHEQALRRFLDDGRLRLDNNPAENALRIVAVGRKAYLFYGSDDHASAAGNILSLAASCKLHRIDPERYFAEVIRILPYWPRDRYLELAPKYWSATRARLDSGELARQYGPITVPEAPAKEQPLSN